ncbi:SDR family NAD(P)-dependent oxidoreductase [Williamsia muralis]|uniref:Short-chain dehydrogenase n=1 Tax=Williamsia marianensis TaxID=85044 RepID=A0A2G3PMV0_WILMA|nr:SDR family oxidoreductase [Williamsia marianensis]PHV67115.1 short-chain dehydrogenase [Williamsia marianensis]
MKRFDGRRVLITGATGGIGQEIAKRFASEGAQLVVTDIERGSCEELVSRLTGNHIARELDVSDEAAWSSITDELEALGGLYGLVNNAALSTLASVVDESTEAWDKVIAVGQTGTWLGMKHAGALIERSGGGSIVNVCSILGTIGVPHSIAYHAAKGAVRGMTKGAAMYWAEAGVRVNSLHPGYIGTPRMLDRLGDPTFRDVTVAKTPTKRLGTPAEVADAVAFLAGPDSGFITGAELYVDGGLTAQ